MEEYFSKKKQVTIQKDIVLNSLLANNIRLSGLKNIKSLGFLSRLSGCLIDNYKNSEYNCESISKDMAISKRHLNRRINDFLGINTSSLLKAYRLNASIDLLIAGQPISYTAFESGFNCSSYFSKCFKQEFNILPKNFI